MNARALKIALAASVALNLFAVAAGTTLVINRERVESHADARQGQGRMRSPMVLVGRLSPESQAPVRQTLRAAAMAARPDFEEARAKRREAIALARSDAFETTQVIALLDQSRAAEMRGRQRLEAEAVALMSELKPADRVIMAEILTRRGRSADRDRSARSPSADTPRATPPA